jgi:stearoyl-CoA desaturase (delta-9 desaturase)
VPTEAWNESNSVRVMEDAGKAPVRRRNQSRAKRVDVAARIDHGVNWPTTIWLIVVHAGALLAPFTFTWQALVVTLVLHWFAGGIGICLGFHRLLTHGSFQTYPIVKYFLATIGMMGGEGSAIDWVANHRKHHALSDQDGDPHSPRDGSWWSHAAWISYELSPNGYRSHIKHWAPDLSKDPVMRFLAKFFIPIHFLTAALLFGFGYMIGGSSMGTSMVVWGLFVRMVAVMHSTWFVNSASHMFGYRNYETTDDSGNVWWVALVTYGEGWHNNHHAYPRMALHGHKWWEFDMTYTTIRLMKLFGLAWDVVDYKHKSEKAHA